MAKPVVIAKRKGFDWRIWYTNNATGDRATMSVFGSATIQDALTEATRSLDASMRDWYMITRIELQASLDTDEPRAI